VIDPLFKPKKKKKKLKHSFRVVIPGKILVRLIDTDLVRSYAPHHLVKCFDDKAKDSKNKKKSLEEYLIPRFPSQKKCDEIFELMTDDEMISFRDMLSCLSRVHDGNNIKMDISTLICSSSSMEFSTGMRHVLKSEDLYDLLTSLSEMYDCREKDVAATHQKDSAISVPLNRCRLVHSSLYMPYTKCAWCQSTNLSHDDHAFWHRKEMRINFDRWVAHGRWCALRRTIGEKHKSRSQHHRTKEDENLESVREIVENETFESEIECLKQLHVCSYCLEYIETLLAQSKDSSMYMRLGVPGFSYSILNSLSSRREELTRRYGDVTSSKWAWYNNAKPRCSFSWWLNSKWGRRGSELWINRSAIVSKETMLAMKKRHGLIFEEEYTRNHNAYDDLDLSHIARKDETMYLATRQIAANKKFLVLSNEHAASIIQNLINLGLLVEVRDKSRRFQGSSLYRFVESKDLETDLRSMYLVGDPMPPIRKMFGHPIIASMSDSIARRFHTIQFVRFFLSLCVYVPPSNTNTIIWYNKHTHTGTTG